MLFLDSSCNFILWYSKDHTADLKFQSTYSFTRVSDEDVGGRYRRYSGFELIRFRSADDQRVE